MANKIWDALQMHLTSWWNKTRKTTTSDLHRPHERGGPTTVEGKSTPRGNSRAICSTTTHDKLRPRYIFSIPLSKRASEHIAPTRTDCANLWNSQSPSSSDFSSADAHVSGHSIWGGLSGLEVRSVVTNRALRPFSLTLTSSRTCSTSMMAKSKGL
jgi:hypothetical protein